MSAETTASRPRLRSLPRNIWAVTATSFLTDVSSEMIFNLLPLFLVNVLGARTAIVGLIEGIAETTASLLKVFSGWLSDRIGTRKTPTVLGYTLSAISKPFLALAGSWAAVLAVRFADRTGKGIRTAPRDALIADSIGEEQRGLAFGLHRAGDTAGALLGLLVALFVVWRMQSGSLILQRATFQRLVWLSLIPALLAVVALVALARDVPVADRRPVPRLTLKGFDRRFRRFVLIAGLFTLGNSADAFLILRAQERGLSVIGVLGMLATFNLVYALASGPAGALSDRVGRRALIVGGWLAYGLLYLGFALAGAAWHIWLLYGLYGLYYGAVEGTAKAYIADMVEKERRGTAYGVYNALVGLMAFPASFIAGLLWQGAGSWPGFGPSAPFLFGSALALLSVALLVIGVPPQEARPAPES